MLYAMQFDHVYLLYQVYSSTHLNKCFNCLVTSKPYSHHQWCFTIMILNFNIRAIAIQYFQIQALTAGARSSPQGLECHET